MPVGMLDGRIYQDNARYVRPHTCSLAQTWRSKGQLRLCALHPCLQLAERHQACLLAHMLLAFLATLQAPEDTGDTRGGLASTCISHGISGQSDGVFCGQREMG